MRKPWIWGLVLLCLGLLGHVAFRFAGSDDLAFALGLYLIPAGVLMLGFGLFFRKDRQLAWILPGVVYASLMVNHWLDDRAQEQQAQQRQAREVVQNVKGSLRELAEQTVLEPDGTPKPIVLQPPTSTVEGDMGLTEVLAKQLLNDVATLQNDYLRALKEAGWETVLDAERLSKDKGMEESRAIISKAQAVIVDYREKSLTILGSLPERVAKAPFSSDAVRRQVLGGAEEGALKGRQNAETKWDYEMKIVQEYGALIEVLAKTQGRVQFENNQMLFEEQEHADLYNAHMARANELIQAQSEFAKDAYGEAVEKLDKAR